MSDSEEEVNSVAIKPPKFLETSVSGWFAIIEAQFHLKRVTNGKTKFYNIIAALPAEVVSRLPSHITDATKTSYDELKEKVIGIYEKTKPEMLDKLMQTTTMTGRPSVYLQELISTAEKLGVGEDIIRHKFIQALPSSISPVIASQGDLEISRLGKLADELLPYMNKSVMSVSSIQQSKVSKVANGDNNSVPRGVKPFKGNQRPKVCRSHIYFGVNAKYCKPWCQWPKKDANVKVEPSSRSSSPSPSGN